MMMTSTNMTCEKEKTHAAPCNHPRCFPPSLSIAPPPPLLFAASPYNRILASLSF